MSRRQSLYDYLHEEVTEENFKKPHNKTNWTIEDERAWRKRLLEEWVGLENNNGTDMNKISKGSSKKAFWKCSKCSREWLAIISNRVLNKTGCKYCDGREPSETNNLYTWCQNNGELGHKILGDWTGIDEDGNSINIYKVTHGSHKNMIWKCKNCEHEWTASIQGITSRHSSCMRCAGRMSQLKTGVNDLQTLFNSGDQWANILKKEWTGINEKGKIVQADKVTRCSTDSYKWICSKGHTWIAQVSNRVNGHTGCPYCSNKSTSYPEQYIRWALTQIFPQTKSRQVVAKSKNNPYGYEYDISIVFTNEQREKYGYPALCIEYSPTWSHPSGNKRDKDKLDLCKKHGVRFIYIREDSDNSYDEQWDKDYISFSLRNYNEDEILW